VPVKIKTNQAGLGMGRLHLHGLLYFRYSARRAAQRKIPVCPSE
jgi:hypothetical protein